MQMTEREQFEAWWPSVGQTIGKAAAWEAWQAARATPKVPKDDGEPLARDFHETYERLAPQYGYETREETREFDASSPNGQLMIAVCREIQAHAIPDTHRLVPVALLKSSAQETVNPFIRAKLQAIIEDKP